MCGNIGLGNGLLPDGTKPSTEPMSTYHQWVLLRQSPEGNFTIIESRLKITYLKFYSNLPGANELIMFIMILQTWEDNVRKQILPQVDVTFHDTVVDVLVNTTVLSTDQRGLKHRFWASAKWQSNMLHHRQQWRLLLTWINFNPNTGK